MIGLNLFAGMECGRLACERIGLKIDKWYASEVDKYAIQVSKANWPDIIHLGDVTKVHAFMLDKIDILMGGSPCQGFSFAGKQLNFEDPRSKLLFEFVRILNEIREYNPEVKFLLENVMMKKEYQDVISNLLGVQPIMVNSALVSAQNRKRLYWTNIPYLGKPVDKGIVLKDILETAVDSRYKLSEQGLQRGLTKKYSSPKFDPDKTGTLNTKNNSGQLSIDSGTTFISVIEEGQNLISKQTGVVLDPGEYKQRNEKSMCLDASYYKGADNHGQRTMIQIEEKSLTLTAGYRLNPSIKEYLIDRKKQMVQVGLADGIKGFDANRRIYSQDGKAPTLISSTGGHKAPKCEIKQLNPSTESGGKQPFMQNRIFDSDYKSPALTLECGRLNATDSKFFNGFTYRKLTPVECERLQTVPDGYTQAVSNTQRYKMLGNGWTVDVIAHLLKPLAHDYAFLF